MKPVMAACSVLLGLSVLALGPSVGARAQTQPAVTPAPAVPASPTPAQPAAASAPQAPTAPAAAPRQTQSTPTKTRGPAPPRAGERRRPSYASCNREAHRRNLRGGSRRRFLIRCKLGYDRPRQPPAGPSQLPLQSPTTLNPARQP